MSNSYLRNKDFLKEMDNLLIKSLTAKITVLTWEEKPIMDFTGKVLPGATINLDGSSGMRRTCNISLSLDENEINITEVSNIISINKKIKLEIGVDNTITDEKYNQYSSYKIIWYPLGIYVIIQPTISRGTSGTTISLQLKDKMCLLNGEMGGTFPASITFNERSYFDDEGNEIIENPTVFQIIYELMNHWGGEQVSNIIIEDIDDKIKKVMRWNNPNYPVYVKAEDYDGGGYDYQYVTNLLDEQKSELGWVAKEYGEDIGYTYTDFVWPEEELIGDIGGTIFDILTKITTLLGNYEFFYDVYGKFHFREKKNYLNTTYTTAFLKMLNEQVENIPKDYYKVDFSNGKSEYTFNDNFLVSSCNNVPQFNMIKNDFVVWGMRKTTDGTTLPIRYHLAIDDKPELSGHLVVLYTDEVDGFKKCAPVHIITDAERARMEANDEIAVGDYYCIYHDAPVSGTTNLGKTKKIFDGTDSYRLYLDYNKFDLDDALNKQFEFNNVPAMGNESNKPDPNNNHPYEWDSTEQTGEPLIYVTDTGTNKLVCVDFVLDDYITYFSNKLYKGVYKAVDTLEGDTKANKIKQLEENNKETTHLVYIRSREWRTELYLQGIEAIGLATDSNYYFTELVNEWPKLYDLEAGEFKEEVLNNPSGIDYYLDFIDTDSPMGEFSIKNIGRRTKTEVNEKLNCVFAPTPLDCILLRAEDATSKDREEMESMGQRYSQVGDDVYDNIIQGGELNSCFNKIRELLYQYTSYCESITLQTIPIYHLDVNTRISVEDPRSNIFGDYFVNRITLPLDCSGTMNISATKALDRI